MSKLGAAVYVPLIFVFGCDRAFLRDLPVIHEADDGGAITVTIDPLPDAEAGGANLEVVFNADAAITGCNVSINAVDGNCDGQPVGQTCTCSITLPIYDGSVEVLAKVSNGSREGSARANIHVDNVKPSISVAALTLTRKPLGTEDTIEGGLDAVVDGGVTYLTQKVHEVRFYDAQTAGNLLGTVTSLLGNNGFAAINLTGTTGDPTPAPNKVWVEAEDVVGNVSDRVSVGLDPWDCTAGVCPGPTPDGLHIVRRAVYTRDFVTGVLPDPNGTAPDGATLGCAPTEVVFFADASSSTELGRQDVTQTRALDSDFLLGTALGTTPETYDSVQTVAVQVIDKCGNTGPKIELTDGADFISPAVDQTKIILHVSSDTDDTDYVELPARIDVADPMQFLYLRLYQPAQAIDDATTLLDPALANATPIEEITLAPYDGADGPIQFPRDEDLSTDFYPRELPFVWLEIEDKAGNVSELVPSRTTATATVVPDENGYTPYQGESRLSLVAFDPHARSSANVGTPPPPGELAQSVQLSAADATKLALNDSDVLLRDAPHGWFDGQIRSWGDLYPGNRVDHAIAGTSLSTADAILFGGRDHVDIFESAFGPLGDTWIYSEATDSWTVQNPTTFPPPAQPLPRYGHSMAWDPGSGTVLMFGGFGLSPSQVCCQFMDDVWKWNPDAVYPDPKWTEVIPLGSGLQRAFAAVASLSDSTADLPANVQDYGVLVFGGTSDGSDCIRELWGWHSANEAWVKVADTASAALPPCGLRGAMAGGDDRNSAGDNRQNSLYLVPGCTIAGCTATAGELWHWPNYQASLDWVQISATGTAPLPEARYGQTLSAYLNSGTWKIGAFGGAEPGGSNPTRYNDAKTLAPSETAWVDGANGPPVRVNGSIVARAGAVKLPVFGGWVDADVDPQVTVLDWTTGAWTSTAEIVPPSLLEAAAAYSPREGCIHFFGGSLDGQPTSTVWATALTTPTTSLTDWASVGVDGSVVATVGSTVWYDSLHGRTFAFGGATVGDPEGTTQLLARELGDWAVESPGSTPSARTGHAVAYDAFRGEAILFGGFDGTNALADTWSFDGNTFTELQPANSPPPRHRHAMAFDSNAGIIYLFGGFVGNAVDAGTRQDLWAWDGEDWTNVTPDALTIEARMDHGMAYTPGSNLLVVVGGRASDIDQPFRDVWVYSPESHSWDSRYPYLYRTDAVVVEIPNEGRQLVWGGLNEAGTLDQGSPGIPSRGAYLDNAMTYAYYPSYQYSRSAAVAVHLRLPPQASAVGAVIAEGVGMLATGSSVDGEGSCKYSPINMCHVKVWDWVARDWTFVHQKECDTPYGPTSDPVTAQVSEAPVANAVQDGLVWAVVASPPTCSNPTGPGQIDAALSVNQVRVTVTYDMTYDVGTP